MKILPVYFTNRAERTQNIQNNPVLITIPKLQTLACDSVSFGRSAGNAEALRALMSYKVPGIYSGKIVIDPKIVEKILNNKVFSGSVKNIVKTLAPFESSLHTVEKSVFNLIKNQAKKSPDKKLDEVMREAAVFHDVKLRAIQQPIFDRLDAMSHYMPLEQQNQFLRLMNVVNKKIYREPIKIPFDKKDFQYKLKRIADELKIKNNKTELEFMQKMMHVAQQLPDDSIQNLSSTSSKAKKNKKIRSQKNISRRRGEIIRKIESLQISSSLKNNEELTKLISRARSQIYDIPVVVNFNRKTFIYELQKIVGTLEDQKLAKRMIQQAVELPKSRENISAFIVKAANCSSEKIGFDLIEGSTGSIEHLVPFASKGNDSLENYAISTAYYNSERGNRTMPQQLKQHPEIYQNAQKHINRLIELYNDGTFKKVGLSKWYITNLARRLYRLSPPEKPIVVDLSKLKD